MDRVVVKPCEKDKFELYQTYEFAGVKIPFGYKTNGADIPRILWSFYPPNSPEYLSAVIIHDYLCDKAQTRAEYEYADRMFLYALMALGVRKSKRIVFYTACRVYHEAKCIVKKIK